MVAMTAREAPDALPARLRTGTTPMVVVDCEPLRFPRRDPAYVALPTLEPVQLPIGLSRDPVRPLDVASMVRVLLPARFDPMMGHAPRTGRFRDPLRDLRPLLGRFPNAIDA
jgi:hypothetical protein